VRTKAGPHDMVTAADEAAERAIEADLARMFPGVPVVGEEAAAADPSLLARVGAADSVFVCDPVDGTANFAAGLPLFGSMLALIRKGEPVAAWIHDPVLKDTAIALRGEGAWVQGADGSRHDLRVAEPAPVARMVAAVSHRYLPPDRAAIVRGNLGALGATWELRCAAHEWRLAVSGKLHGLLYWRLYPWDHAPGVLLHAEAGGYARRLDGQPYHAGVHTGGLLAAPDRAGWEALKAALFAA
jgi:fructose-1,6-bisphosphatase/inositol monophosphatase family enzyme